MRQLAPLAQVVPADATADVTPATDLAVADSLPADTFPDTQPTNPPELTCAAAALAQTTAGCTFWAVDLDNALIPNGSGGFCDAQNQQFAVALANPNTATATILVQTSGGKSATYAVAGGAAQVIKLPDPLWKVPPVQQAGAACRGRPRAETGAMV